MKTLKKFLFMCEWLSCGQWYDVYLLCGDRIFSAHRAVLASVSGFLRSLLLSNPAEETPTFIVLPDFDIDAVSLVLYYIYNGEVIVKKSKLKMFLEIISTMKIFIDSDYLLKISNFLQKSQYDFDKQRELVISNHTVPALINTDGVYKQLNNTKDDIQFYKIYNEIKHSPGNTELIAVKQQTSSYVSKLNERLAGYLKSQFDSRQKRTFSRDLFIKTYSLNGNTNGVTGDVLAICNEHYREPTSVLLTNALTVNALSEKITMASTSDNILTSHLTMFNRPKKRDNTDYISKFHDVTKPNVTYIGIETLNDSESLRYHDEYTRNKDLYQNKEFELITASNQINSKNPKGNFNYGQDETVSHISSSDKEVKIKNKNISSKGSIFNEVLQNPWRSRLEYFRPLSGKAYDLATLPQTENVKTVNNRPHLNEGEGINTVVTSTVTKVKENEALENISFKCYICKQVFADNDIFSIHMRQHSSRYTCVECHKSFSQLRNFKYHMSVHRGTKEFAATCPTCGKYFNDKGYLSSHMKIHRNNKEYKCSLCPKSFNQRVAYNMHVRIHTGIKPHICDECGKAFSRKMLLKQHQRTHSGERPYACSYCDKRFADRSNMTLHLRLHTGVKPFICTFCPKSFTKKHHLKSHLNFHTGDKPYSCPRCKLAFTQSSNMRTHYKKCNNQSTKHNVTS